METKDFDYKLPEALIAQIPLAKRDHSRLMLLDRTTSNIEHSQFYNIGKFLHPGDLLITNNSRVIPARLKGTRVPTGGKMECLLLEKTGIQTWKALLKPGRSLKTGYYFSIEGVNCKILEEMDEALRVIYIEDESVIEKSGNMPLPPYIHTHLDDTNRYQTVYAKFDGSAAAPTAGLHFTKPLLENLQTSGINIASVTLHVGLDTFKPVSEENPLKHKIHTEYFEVNKDTAEKINLTRENGGRIIAVGTTSVRVLEQISLSWHQGYTHKVKPTSGWANIFILPGHKFNLVDGMITNFHMPRSTLLMLVSAFAGRELIMDGYQTAIQNQYRFYSFGDCMLII